MKDNFVCKVDLQGKQAISQILLWLFRSFVCLFVIFIEE